MVGLGGRIFGALGSRLAGSLRFYYIGVGGFGVAAHQGRVQVVIFSRHLVLHWRMVSVYA